MKFRFLPVVVALMCVLPLDAEVRNWTAKDGRVLEAELIRRTETDVTLRRTADGKEFTLPLAGFSEADQAWVAQSTVAITKPVDVEKLKALQASVPKLKVDAPLDANWPTCIQIRDKYVRAIAHIRGETIAQNVKNIQLDMDRDLRVLKPITETRLTNPPVFVNGTWSKGGGAWADVWAARSNIAWLQGPLLQHLSQIEALGQN